MVEINKLYSGDCMKYMSQIDEGGKSNPNRYSIWGGKQR